MDITINPRGGVVNIYVSETHIGEGELDELEETAEQEVASIESITDRDEDRATFFKKGWDAALRETMLRFVAGTLPEFYNEQGQVHDSGQAEDLDRAAIILSGRVPEDEDNTDVEIGADAPEELPLNTGVARPAADSGEPEKEVTLGWSPNAGTWTMSDDELQARLDAEFQRGLNYESPTVGKRYMPEEIAVLVADGHAQGVKDAKPGKVQFSRLRVIADKLAGEPRDPQTHATIDELLIRVATELGFEVVR